MLSSITAKPANYSRASCVTCTQHKPPLHCLQLLPTYTPLPPPLRRAQHFHHHPTLIQSRGGYSMMMNTMVLGILILVGMVHMNSEVAHAYTFYEGNEKFLILTYTDFFHQATAQSYCQGYTEGSTRYVLGLVRSSSQDYYLQQYLTSNGIGNAWSGAYSTGYSGSYYDYYNRFYWMYGYGGASTARSRKGVTILPDNNYSPGSPYTTILYNSALSYYSTSNMGGYWGRNLRAHPSTYGVRSVVCVVSKCNVADDPSYKHDNVECTGRGTLTGYYPNCQCVCMTGWTGVTCHIRIATRSNTFTLTSTFSPPLTASPTLTASLSLPNTTTRTKSVSPSPSANSMSSTASASLASYSQSMSLPHTSSNPHTGTHSTTMSLPITHSLTSTQTLTESQTASGTSTFTLSLSGGTPSSSTTMSLSKTSSISVSESLSSSFSSSWLSVTSSISGSESQSFTFSNSWSESSSQTTSLSSSTTFSLSASTSISTSTTLSISLSPTEGSSTYTESFSESMSSSSNCGILEYAFGGPGLCIMLNTTGREDGLECNASSTVRPVPTALMINASSERVVPEAEFVPSADAAILSVDASVWASGTVIAAAVHLALPLKMRNHWGNALEANSIGPDGLVEVTAFVNETSRSGVGRVLGSTTIRFYRYRGQELVPGGEGAWRPLPPSNASATGAGRAEVAKLLKGAPEGRIGMVVVYNGPRNDKAVSQTDSSMFFELDEKVIECGERIDRLAFGVRLEGLVTLASAVSEISQQALAVLQTVGTVTSAFTLMPSVVLQLGVQSSIKEMAECQNFWVDVVEAGVGKYRLVDLEWLSGTKLQQLTSPYGIGIGALGETHPTWIEGVENSTDSHLIQAARAKAMTALHEVGQYYRGAILTSILNLTIFTVAVICAVFIVYIGKCYAGLLVPKATFKESILDAAAFVQVPSISLLGVSLLMDGLAEGSVTLISIRAKFSSESDGYASVFRTTVLEAGVTGQIMMSGVDGYLVAPGWTEASIIDMVLSAVSLSVVIIYIVHIAYVVTGKRLAVVLVPVEYSPEEDSDEEASPMPQIENSEIDDENDSCNNNADGDDITIRDDGDDAISLVAASIGNDSLLSALTPTSATNRNNRGDHSSDFHLAVSRSNNGSFDLFSDDGNDGGVKLPKNDVNEDDAHKQPEGPQTWKMWRIEWFELQEHWVPPGDDSIGGPSYDAGVAWIRKYGMYVGGTTWAPYMVLELAIAFVVTGLEGYITSDPDKCTMKCTIALVLLGFQLAAVLFFKPLAAKFDLRITTVSLSLSFTVGVLITLNITLQNVYITILADIITVVASMVASVYGIVGGINSVLSIIDVLGTVKKTFATAQRRKALREQAQREYDADHINDEDDDDDDDGLLPALIVEDINNMDHIENQGIELEDLQQQQQEEQNDEDAENEPELSEGEEKEMWTTYLVELEQKEVPDDEKDDDATIAIRDAILPPLPPDNDENDDDEGNNNINNNDPTSSSAGLLNEVVSRVQPQLYEEEEWAAFFEKLDANNNINL